MVLNSKYKLRNSSIGQIFTPEYIAEFMVKNVRKFLPYSIKKDHMKVLEPCAGKGVFLKFLLQNRFKKITAYEIDRQLDIKLLKKYPEINFRFENFLGSDPQERFDLIIGNPPYLGQNYNAPVFQDLVSNFPNNKKFFVGNMDLFYFFIHLGILKLNPGGILSFITTNYWITKSKKTGIKLLKPHILNECYILQYIDLSRLKIFKDAPGQHNCIFVLQKKNEREKIEKVDKSIEIIQIMRNKREINDEFNKIALNEINCNQDSPYIKKYLSALTNNSLSKEGSWNLLYPVEIKQIVDQISSFCRINKHTAVINDFFIIRNGLILIKDDIFILKPGQNIKVVNKEFWIKINGHYFKLTDEEKQRLKKLYKSKSIRAYGYDKSDFVGYLIFFNKTEFEPSDDINELYREKYPHLVDYLKIHEMKLNQILINAKENPKDIFFPRRGHFIVIPEGSKNQKLMDLEPLYDKGDKIFFKFISKTNTFGYSNKQYYATSDTYFMWPKKNEIDYLFILAYLNSKLVRFLFKAKNISIKRSKTKLEDELLVPNLDLFQSYNQKSLMSLISTLTEYLTEFNVLNQLKLNKFKQKIHQLELLRLKKYRKVLDFIEHKNIKQIQKFIDLLLFELFDLDEKELDYLITTYY
ncbi:MAG: Eco57I restriction-modification methylase domain-containing protein [Candidatus Heimdallarchaeota archaeon]